MSLLDLHSLITRAFAHSVLWLNIYFKTDFRKEHDRLRTDCIKYLMKIIKIRTCCVMQYTWSRKLCVIWLKLGNHFVIFFFIENISYTLGLMEIIPNVFGSRENVDICFYSKKKKKKSIKENERMNLMYFIWAVCWMFKMYSGACVNILEKMPPNITHLVLLRLRSIPILSFLTCIYVYII